MLSWWDWFNRKEDSADAKDRVAEFMKRCSWVMTEVMRSNGQGGGLALSVNEEGTHSLRAQSKELVDWDECPVEVRTESESFCFLL